MAFRPSQAKHNTTREWHDYLLQGGSLNGDTLYNDIVQKSKSKLQVCVSHEFSSIGGF